jgi:hypothetical protein
MADPKEPKEKSQRRKPSPEDLEKTVVDIDIRHLKEQQEELEEASEETMMVRLPKDDDLDHLETEDFFDKEEHTGDHVVPEIPAKKLK